MTKEYKMLWFAVDMPHRQRYFFICGCKRTMNPAQRDEGGNGPPLKPERPQFGSQFALIVLSQDSFCTTAFSGSRPS